MQPPAPGTNLAPGQPMGPGHVHYVLALHDPPLAVHSAGGAFFSSVSQREL